MAVYRSTQVTANAPLMTSDGANHEVTMFGDWTVPAAGLVTGDIIEMVGLPAGYVPVTVIADHDNLGTAFTAAVGLMSGTYRDPSQSRTCGAEFIAAATYQAAALKTMNVAGGTRIAPITEAAGSTTGIVGDRSIGFVISGTLTAPVAGAKLRVTVKYRPQVDGA